ncbi:unnamed protein product [Urochloa humidicola]
MIYMHQSLPCLFLKNSPQTYCIDLSDQGQDEFRMCPEFLHRVEDTHKIHMGGISSSFRRISSAAEERAGGKSAAAAAAASAAGKRQAAGLGPVMGLGVPDQQPQHQQQQGGGGAGSSSKPAPKLELPRIYTTLSRKEKEEDFLAMKGTKLPQRPKRRPKNVEKAVNFICPGTWLSDVTRSRYEVREKKCPKKQQKHRGLKGMESMDSDSD